MATVIFTPAAISVSAAKDYYEKRELAQEQLFAYYHHLNSGDDELAIAAFNEFLRCGNEAADAHKIYLEKHNDWAMWRANRR
ncbi:hypothetical protein BKG91_03840 [Rodentibacter caecimuris]|uniref:Uncharacterized protein n=1 Tax=Rodentibacter caecimuris TaxID=1796644 RepID=A0AAJ3MYS1_9PAST|nr:hypothetical protein [Rodentibacter heylii]OOF70571.1 hypothetical protein BKG90_09790 [Rodentibacter heylii]OOF75258.1 hypothetical protein BKG91_03840 [Rodentibacter heylii]OOF77186.1 hypothetical protein BKG99_03970 [Rodentibacter heylii]